MRTRRQMSGDLRAADKQGPLTPPCPTSGQPDRGRTRARSSEPPVGGDSSRHPRDTRPSCPGAGRGPARGFPAAGLRELLQGTQCPSPPLCSEDGPKATCVPSSGCFRCVQVVSTTPVTWSVRSSGWLSTRRSRNVLRPERHQGITSRGWHDNLTTGWPQHLWATIASAV